MENYVAHLGLDDPEEFFTAEEPLTDRIISQGSVTDMNLLKRQIVVRIFNALNIRHYARCGCPSLLSHISG